MSGSAASLQYFDSIRSGNPAQWLSGFGLPLELAGEGPSLRGHARTVGDDVVIDLDWSDATLIVDRPRMAMVVRVIDTVGSTSLWRDARPIAVDRDQALLLPPGTTWSIHGDARLRVATISETQIIRSLPQGATGHAPFDLGPVASLIGGMMQFLVDPSEDDEFLVPADCHEIIVGLTRLSIENGRAWGSLKATGSACRPTSADSWGNKPATRRTRCRRM